MLKLVAVVPLLVVVAVTQPGCDWGGCANGSSCDPGVVIGPDMATTQPRACPGTCPGGCSLAGEQCFIPPASSADYAFCAKPCVDDRDCGAGVNCVVLLGAMLSPACLPEQGAIGCSSSGGGVCDTASTCHDANTADVAHAASVRGICGWLRVHCANGCTNGACN
jgi:hypothetical protein